MYIYIEIYQLFNFEIIVEPKQLVRLQVAIFYFLK
jgi:hypothetical protein